MPDNDDGDIWAVKKVPRKPDPVEIPRPAQVQRAEVPRPAQTQRVEAPKPAQVQRVEAPVRKVEIKQVIISSLFGLCKFRK